MSRENMKKSTVKKFIFIAAVVVLPFLLLLLILVAFPTPAVQSPVVQEEGMSPEILRTRINGWNGGGTGGLSAAVSGDIVTVTGNVTGATSALRLNIPAGVSIVWQAYLTGNLTGGHGGVVGLIHVNGNGTFEVASGKIENTAGFWRSATILSGVLDGNGRVVRDNGKVTVSGGTVESNVDGGTAIYVNRGTVEVSGGIIEARGDGGIAIYAGHGVTVSGGTIEARGDGGTAIFSSGNIEVSGGTISAADGTAINAGTESTISVKGGLVFAHGSEIVAYNSTFTSPDMDEVIYIIENEMGYRGKFNKPTGSGVIIAWDASKGAREYTAGTTADLTTEPAGAAEWGNDGNNSGIRYGVNGFFIIPDITVITP